VTDKELRDLAVAALKKTTISYPMWVARQTQGKFPDVKLTQWWKAFDYLTQIGVVAPPPPPPVGKQASPGQMPAVLAGCSSGDAVTATAGNHPKLILNKSFVAQGVAIRCASGAFFSGIDTNGQSGYTFDGVVSKIPAEPNDINVTPFYLHGGSQRINLTGAFQLQGGYDGIKVYGGSQDCTIDDGGGASDISGYGGDGIHVNQSTNLWIKSVSIGNPWDYGATPEHNDGIHAQAFTNLRIGGGAAGGVVRLTALVTPRTPRSDVDSAGMFIRGEGTGANGLVIDGVSVHWQIGRAFQLIDIAGAVSIRALSITDSGITGDSPAITFGVQPDQHVDVWGPLTGFSEADCYWSYGRAQTTFHT